MTDIECAEKRIVIAPKKFLRNAILNMAFACLPIFFYTFAFSTYENEQYREFYFYFVMICCMLWIGYGVFVLLSFLNEQYVWDTNGFEYTNFYGRKSTYAYENIMSLEQKTPTALVMNMQDGRKIDVLSTCRGGNAFIAMVQEKFFARANGTANRL